MSYSKVIGDTQSKATRNIATALPFPQVLASEIADQDHQINSTLKSGKKVGSSVIDEAGILYIAVGSEKDSAWTKQTDGSAVTPA